MCIYIYYNFILAVTLAPLKQPTFVQRENDLQLLVYEA